MSESLAPEKRAPFRLARLNPFGALLRLVRLVRRHEIRGLVTVYALITFAQMTLPTTFVLYTSFRFGWTAHENGIALLCVGVTSIVVQAVLLAALARRLGEVRVALPGIASGGVAHLLYGLATQGWMMYAIILCNLLSFAAGQALQAVAVVIALRVLRGRARVAGGRCERPENLVIYRSPYLTISSLLTTI